MHYVVTIQHSSQFSMSMPFKSDTYQTFIFMSASTTLTWAVQSREKAREVSISSNLKTAKTLRHSYYLALIQHSISASNLNEFFFVFFSMTPKQTKKSIFDWMDLSSINFFLLLLQPLTSLSVLSHLFFCYMKASFMGSISIHIYIHLVCKRRDVSSLTIWRYCKN